MLNIFNNIDFKYIIYNIVIVLQLHILYNIEYAQDMYIGRV